MRRRVRELLSPLVPDSLRRRRRLLRLLTRRCRGRVLNGPFVGMRYLSESHGSVLWPKMLGTYELEITEPLERWLDEGVSTALVGGAAEGYYAVGIAFRSPQTRVVAWEADPAARQLLQQLAGLNGVDDRVEMRGRCEVEEFEAALRGVARPAVILDVEGDEASLLDPVRVPSLRGARILVETHEFIVPEVEILLEERLSRTHLVTHVQQRRRTPEDARVARIPARFELQLQDLLSEMRPAKNAWLVCEPRLR